MGSRWAWHLVMSNGTDTLETAAREKAKDLVAHPPGKANSGHNQRPVYTEHLALQAVRNLLCFICKNEFLLFFPPLYCLSFNYALFINIYLTPTK